MYQDVLLPVEPDDVIERSIEHGVAVADRFDATVHAMIVREGAGSVKRDHTRVDPDELVTEAAGTVERMATRADVPMTETVREGVAENAIVDYAESTGVDLIVMGTRAETGLDGVLQGSVTESVLESTEIPVLAVRVPPE